MAREFKVTVTETMLQKEGSTAGRILQRVLHFSRREISRLKFQGEILVNGTRVHVHACLQPGDELTARFPQDQDSAALSSLQFEPEILLEEPDFVIVNKPAGMPVHAGHGHLEDSLGTLLAGWYQAQGQAMTVRAIGRLDLEVSGAMLYARNQPAAARLSRQRQYGILQKTYLAIIEGTLDTADGVIDLPIEKVEGERQRRASAEGKRAVTGYRVLASWPTPQGERSLVRVRILTGRTHQIRLHFAAIGHPLIGDTLYGGSTREISRPALHCAALRLRSPFSGVPAAVTAPLPADLLACLPNEVSINPDSLNEA